MPDMIEAKKKSLLSMIQRYAVTRQPVTLASGLRSEVYIDLRQVTLRPVSLSTMTSWLVEVMMTDDAIPRREFWSLDAVGGPATAAIPLITTLVYEQIPGMPRFTGFYIRGSDKSYGRMQMIEGPWGNVGEHEEPFTVALIDDVVTTGHSLWRCVEIVRGAGAIVAGCYAIVDREQGATAVFAEQGIPFRAMCTMTEVLNV